MNAHTTDDDGAADRATPPFDDPAALATTVAGLPRPLLIGLDVDGVLAPIVPHADDALLADGVGALLERLDAIAGVDVVVVSGRSLAGLAQFKFAPGLTVVGSHGGEVRGEPELALTEAERSRHNLLWYLATRAAQSAGRGAWVERKPASVVLHVRQAEPARANDALTALQADVAALDGITTTPGSEVLEIFARPASKGGAIEHLRTSRRPASIVYVGDDVTDEEAFAVLGPGDVAIKVGAGRTIAGHRLPDPPAVIAWLAAAAPALES